MEMKMLSRSYSLRPHLQRRHSAPARHRHDRQADKLREARLRWYGHVLRADNATVCNIALNLEVPGKRPKGRPKQRWIDTLRSDLKLADIHTDQSHDRAKWRQRTSKADPTIHGTYAKEEISRRSVKI
ncbi:hypothetical protein Y032_0144g2447 [Ancylostoma ceylanicum]|uniref:Uncharacterized protein n=1 Tax=Ancylostoma ceylanicum TaxID=53326 RepID=A0A016T2Q3_9BILA|nr:hypothetical protein Y032_0144g2447 [Ancylostoma ceylanicum]